jgi:hypothetical protein
MTLTCCYPDCLIPAEFGILSEGATPDLETHACDDHLTELMEGGVSTVWPIPSHAKEGASDA